MSQLVDDLRDHYHVELKAPQIALDNQDLLIAREHLANAIKIAEVVSLCLGFGNGSPLRNQEES